MNYRHAYHAGNFADVFKHAALLRLVDHLKAKDKPFVVIDTHAGIGRYDLQGIEAGKTGEAAGGIGRLLASGHAGPVLEAYIAAVAAANPDWPEVRFYPGSPVLTRGLLRPGDRLVAVEKHPEDHAALRALFAHDHWVQIRDGDGYAALKALLPPKERRGLVLIDPPFEDADEFRSAAQALREGLRRWATGIFVLWYPIKVRDPVDRFLAEATQLERPALTAEFLLTPPDDDTRLNGAGLLVINPPWRSEIELTDLIKELGPRLSARGPSGVRWLRRD